MTVYVITDGCYLDYHIIAVSTDKDKAEKLAKMFGADVEEWETDTARDRRVIEGFRRYRVYFNREGYVHWVADYTDNEYVAEGVAIYSANRAVRDKAVDVVVWAKNKADAIKIAAEKRAQYLAEMEGIT